MSEFNDPSQRVSNKNRTNEQTMHEVICSLYKCRDHILNEVSVTVVFFIFVHFFAVSPQNNNVK